MVTLLTGLVGGLIATFVMTAFMMSLGDDSPPPTASLWAKYVGSGNPEDYVPQGMALHTVYGIVAGAIFVLVFSAIDIGFPVGSLVGGLGWGIVWGIVLFVVSAVFWMNVVLGMDPEPKQAAKFLLFHVVYGVVLGAWVWSSPVTPVV